MKHCGLINTDILIAHDAQVESHAQPQEPVAWWWRWLIWLVR